MTYELGVAIGTKEGVEYATIISVVKSLFITPYWILSCIKEEFCSDHIQTVGNVTNRSVRWVVERVVVAETTKIWVTYFFWCET